MGDKTGIQWTDSTWNPISGCTKVSAGCKNCYAERLHNRFTPLSTYPRFTDIVLHPDRLEIPLHWRKPRRIFVVSMGDLFHEAVSEEFIRRVLTVCDRAADERGHTFQILTKRPDRMATVVREWWTAFRKEGCEPRMDQIWLGTSVEDQATADERIPHLLATPAAVRFVSYEPALGPVDFQWDIYTDDLRPNWVICGGESGPHARPSHPDWFRQVRDQCQAAGVPFFFKQFGEWSHVYDFNAREHTQLHVDGRRKGGLLADNSPGWEVMSRVGKRAAGRLLDGKEWSEFPGGGAR